MSTSSRPKKVNKKGGIKQLKIVETISKHGYDAIKLEEDKTPRGRSQKSPPTHPRKTSSSPVKRQKLEFHEAEPIDFDMDGLDLPNKRRTMVSVIKLCLVS